MNEETGNNATGMDAGQPPATAPTSGEIATSLAHDRTNLALQRNFLALERTLMGWIRTALSMISFGFTIGKLGQVLHNIEYTGVLGVTRTLNVKDIAYFLVILGTGSLLAAAFQYWRRMRDLYRMGFGHQFGLAFVVALLLVAVGGFALASLMKAV
jgi:putative membrane protein